MTNTIPFRDEYSKLFEFVKKKNLRMKNIGGINSKVNTKNFIHQKMNEI